MRGVPQGAHSSTILFNMHSDDLGTEVSAIAKPGQDEGEAESVTDDVLLQETTPAKIHQLLHSASWWQGVREASRFTEKTSSRSAPRASRTGGG